MEQLDFEKADQIWCYLYEKYQINVDDKSQEWRVLLDDYIQTKAEKGAHELTGMDISFVTSQLAKPIILKKDRSYGKADAIRDDLQGSYSILLDDKKRERKIVCSSRKRKFATGTAPSQPTPYKPKRIEDDADYDPWFDDNVVDDEESAAIDTSADNTTTITDADPEEEMISSSISRDDLMSLTIPLLKDKRCIVGKPVSGKKVDLVDRLLY